MHATPDEQQDIEIVATPPLSPEQAALLDLHSILNVLNVLTCELHRLGATLANEPDALVQSLVTCERITHALRRPRDTVERLSRLPQDLTAIRAEIETLLAAHPDRRDDPETAAAQEAISAILTLLKIRSAEYLDRVDHPGAWREFTRKELNDSLLEIFAALQRHSRDRFGFSFGASQLRPHDYLVDLVIDDDGEGTIWMPPVFKDVIRDLVANARKYTEPGGTLEVSLVQSVRELQLIVADNGRGIPEDELPKVVQFGYRARNALRTRTMGGGFGLTKAHWVARHFGGHFWIASQLGGGTRVRLVIPRHGGG